MWPRTRKSRLSILPEVNNKGNKVKTENNSDIFIYKNFYARFIANVDDLFTTILSVV
jgi:hypothetical protein